MSKLLEDIENILASNLPTELKERLVRELVAAPAQPTASPPYIASTGRVYAEPTGRPRMSVPDSKDMKKCPKCKKIKNVVKDFGVFKKKLMDGSSVDRPVSWCRECRSNPHQE